MNAPTSSNKILFICGPTATGKTALAAKLAKQFNDELISADSRQVYRGMDIGTGKDRPRGVVIHGYDLVNPDQDFSVADWVKFAWDVITKLWQQHKLPIVVGGTGLYLKSLINPPISLRIPPKQKLRHQLNQLTVSQLQNQLLQLNPTRFNHMNHSDQNNPRRLIRAIEVAHSQTPELTVIPKLSALWLGLTASPEVIDQRIRQRVIQRANSAMTREVKPLIDQFSDWSLPAFSATGYRPWRDYLEGKINQAQAIALWQTTERQYARRQLTWFAKMPQLSWFDVSNSTYLPQVVQTVKAWYN